jgi:ATP-binding cassette, subfamily G (WHITE), member 1
MWKASTTPRPATSITDPQLLAAAYSKVKKPTLPKLGTATFCKRDDRYATTFCRQFYLLLMRTFIILRRDKSMTRMRFFVHCLVGGLIGILYLGIGNNAAHAFNNFNYAFFSIMFLMFTAFSSMQMQCK